MPKETHAIIDALNLLEAQAADDLPFRAKLFRTYCGCSSPLLLMPSKGGYYTRPYAAWIVAGPPVGDTSVSVIGVSAFWCGFGQERAIAAARLAHHELMLRLAQGWHVDTNPERGAACVIFDGGIIPAPRE